LRKIREKLDREAGQRIYLYKQKGFSMMYEQSTLILIDHKSKKQSHIRQPIGVQGLLMSSAEAEFGF